MPEVQIGQRNMFHQYQQMKHSGNVPAFADTGHRVFSQFEEDGKLLFIFSLMGMGKKQFLEIGSDDGLNSNCANLAFHFGWTGLFIDANTTSIERGRRFYAKHPHPYTYPPKFINAKVNCENINQLIKDGGLEGDIELMSIDIDGNDYWIWNCLEQVKPKVIVIETHVEFGRENKVVPYDPNYVYPGKHPLYHGASPEAMKRLGEAKGYRLVGANDLGFNFFFVREDLLQEELPAVNLDAILWHESHSRKPKELEAIKDWPYEVPHP